MWSRSSWTNSSRAVQSSTACKTDQCSDAGRPAGFRCHSNTYASPAENADEEVVDEVACEACGVDTWFEGNWLLLCDADGCERAYHTLCLPAPHFSEIPDGDWFCPACAESRMEVEVEVEAEMMDQCDGEGDGLEVSQHVDVDEIDGFVIEARG